MCALGTRKTYSVGDVLTASDLNTHQRDSQQFLAQPPGAKARHSTETTGIADEDSGVTQLFFDTEVYDTDSMYASSESGKLTFHTAGKYLLQASGRLFNNDENLILRIVNSTSSLGVGNAYGGSGGRQFASVSVVASVSTGDVAVVGAAVPTTGQALAGDTLTPFFAAMWLSS